MFYVYVDFEFWDCYVSQSLEACIYVFYLHFIYELFEAFQLELPSSMELLHWSWISAISAWKLTIDYHFCEKYYIYRPHASILLRS